MVFNAPDSLQAGKHENNSNSNINSFRNPKPVNMNMNSNCNNINKKKNKKWKNKKNGSPANNISSKNNALAMAIPRFNAPQLAGPHLFPMQAVAPSEPYFMMNNTSAPPMDSCFGIGNVGIGIGNSGFGIGNRNHNMAPRNTSLKKRNSLQARKKNNLHKLYSPLMKAPLAPRNTTSFIMRAKKLGGIAPAVTPSPATPAVLPTPLLSPGVRDKGSLEEMNRELGVDGYGSMNGLIRLRSYQDRVRDAASESESDVEQGDLLNEDQSIRSVERLEQRIDQGLSRFEMIYPTRAEHGNTGPQNLENCVNSQERLIAHLEEENLTLKERLFLVEQELNELRHRVREMEEQNHRDENLEEQFEESCGDVSTPCE